MIGDKESVFSFSVAALELIHEHGGKFSSQLFERYDTLFHWFVRWCGTRNRDDQKAGHKAMDTFILVISNILELQSAEESKKGVQVFKVRLCWYRSSHSQGCMKQ